MAFNGVIDLDPCSNEQASVGATDAYSLPLVDGLTIPWHGPNVFVNPPFGVSYLHKTARICISAKEKKALQDDGTFNPEDWQKQSIADWVKKCWNESIKVNETNIALLIPAAVDTKHWQKIIFPYAGAICFLEGRVHFYENGQKGGPAPMPCAIVGFGPYSYPASEKWEFNAFDILGKVLVP
jgi:hypothetical protein